MNPAYYNAGSFPSSYPGFWGNVALNAATQAAAPQPGAPAYVTNYAAVAQSGSINVADLTDTFGDLDAFKAKGGKMVTFVGANDALIMPRGVLNYYRVMAQRYALHHDSTGFDGVQQFYRLFHVPGTSHCGLPILSNGASLGPWPQGGVDFDAVINWVENGVAPSEVIGSGNTNDGYGNAHPSDLPLSANRGLLRQRAAFTKPQNWICGGNLEKKFRGTPLSGQGPAGAVLRRPCAVQARGQRTARLCGQRRQPDDVRRQRALTLEQVANGSRRETATEKSRRAQRCARFVAAAV